ncbi:MAG TPA: FtsX-like permease family protein [Ktedonobacterales bacterium]|jgi:putative ABC transport system permease protein
MQALFGIPLETLKERLLLYTIVAAIVVVVLALRKPILLKIGLRNVPRRKMRMLLIVFGLMLSTSFITAALAVGDTITTAVRSVAVFNYGRIDEIIEGGHGPLGLFPYNTYIPIADEGDTNPDIAGVAPALQEDNLVLADETARQVRSSVTALAIPPDAANGFGGMYDAEGTALDSGTLGPNDIYLNAALGTLLNARVGDRIYVYSDRWPGQRFQFTVRGIIAKSGLVGDTPTFILPLFALQGIEHTNEINRIFIANRGDGLTGVNLTDGITHRLRRLLPLGLSVNEIKEHGVEQAENANDIFTRIFTLFALFSLAIGVLLIFLIFVLLSAERRAEMGVSRAIGVQRGQLVQLFLFEGSFYDLIASLVGIAFGVGLGALLVALLRPTLTRVGFPLELEFQPTSLIISYCLGALFTLGTIVASAWIISRMTIVYAMRDLPEPPRQPLSLLKLVGQWAAHMEMAFFVSNGDLSPARAALALPGDVLSIAWGLITRGIGPLLIGWMLLQRGIATYEIAPFSLGLSLMLVGVALVIRWCIVCLPGLFRAVGLTRNMSTQKMLHLHRQCLMIGDRVAAAVAGLGLLLYWALPYDTLVSLGFPRFGGGIEVFFFSGVMMVLGAIWVLTFNADLLLLPLIWLLRGLRKLGFILHTALVYPLHYRFRTGINLVMFTLVIFTMTVMAVLSSSVANSYGDIQHYTGGYDIQARPFFQPIADIHAAIAHAPGINPSDFESVSSETIGLAGVLQLSAPHPRWSYYPINIVDGGFLDGLGDHLVARAPGYATDDDVWKALRTHPNFALIDSRALPPSPDSPYSGYIPSPGQDELDAIRAISSNATSELGGLPNQYLYQFSGAYQGDATIPATPVWVGDIRGGTPVKLTIIGVVDNLDGLHYGLVTSQQGFAPAQAGLPALPIQTQRYFFKVRPGVDPHTEAVALGSAFLDNGLETTVLADVVVDTNGARIFISQILLGVVGLTLLLGLAALAVTGTRAVVERRQQIGMLRALGYQRWSVQLSFLLEFLLVGIAGTYIGMSLGLVLCRNVFAANFFEQYQTGITLLVPWQELGVIALCAGVASLLAAFLPAWQAGRVSPADALRYE